MTISQGTAIVAFGVKGAPPTGFKKYRLTRRNIDSLARNLSSLPNFYYAKIFRYERLGRNKGFNREQVAYIYWDKDGFLTVKYN
ncbi:MAG: hypothetical protein NXH86_02805 [Flavobacteriaceae bacterium]|uniref:Uncharacterized protein n=1 Tax=Flagellimonas alvinocaridis TaxID=2530200 RepID=A0A4S8RGR1_9FLAO|nr:hypothetical protein [Allomuricauda alvinocaridis]MCR9263056.1 hypothetical protein [Flavobacteriaceae bacterium]THV57090.1 hypothetical protein EZV76_15855 [Allomuricauda alvinocaridis]